MPSLPMAGFMLSIVSKIGSADMVKLLLAIQWFHEAISSEALAWQWLMESLFTNYEKDKLSSVFEVPEWYDGRHWEIILAEVTTVPKITGTISGC